MMHRLFLLMVVLMTAITTVYADDDSIRHQPIHEKLSIEQGYYTRLNEPIPFGMFKLFCVTLMRVVSGIQRL